ncbi:hypothetical protein BGL_2c16000 [Burkholderia plantarii]|uniref:Methyltransferase domain-containing protein n=2 Tax=Burkholderia plantarii TaxID=41899 RepID=A0A0B6RWC0_BURPL|nr:hypothetical protein BGL_2c16000 [Burkholderia plantarii]
MAMREADPYVQSAELYDLLSETHWQARRASLAATLEQVRDAEVVLDIGTGTGPYLPMLAAALPVARIHAVEPSASMRVGLMTRIVADAELRRRVSVQPVGFDDARLPARIDFAMVCGCLGFMDEAARARLWRRLAASLAPDARVLADLMPLDRPQVVDEMRAVSTEVGAHRYDVWLSGAPAGDDRVRWTTRYEQWDGEHLVRRFTVERDWHAFALTRLIDEAAVAGLQAQRLDASPVPAVLLRPQAAGAA